MWVVVPTAVPPGVMALLQDSGPPPPTLGLTSSTKTPSLLLQGAMRKLQLVWRDEAIPKCRCAGWGVLTGGT